MEMRNEQTVYQAPSTSTGPCPKCHSPMEAFDGADVKDRNYRGQLCTRCRWFKGTRSLGYGMRRVGPRADGNYDEEYEGKIRPRER